MKINKINYVVILGITVCVTFLYNMEEMRFLLSLELMLPLILELWLFLVWRKVDVELHMPYGRVLEGDRILFVIQVKNRSWFPASRVFVELEVEDCYTGKKEKGRIWVQADARDEVRISKNQTSIHCGRYLWRVRRIGLYDYLGIFCRQRKREFVRDILVLPMDRDLTFPRFTENTDMSWENEKYDEHRCGDDVSEIFQIRPYRGGDTMQRIHWKMTAKEDELMVKDYGYPLTSQFYLCLDFAAVKGKDRWEDELDEFLETALSLCLALTQAQYIYEAVWCEAGGRIRQVRIEEEEDVHEMMAAMVYGGPCQERESFQTLTKSMGNSGRGLSIYSLDAERRLYREELLLADFGKDSG